MERWSRARRIGRWGTTCTMMANLSHVDCARRRQHEKWLLGKKEPSLSIQLLHVQKSYLSGHVRVRQWCISARAMYYRYGPSATREGYSSRSTLLCSFWLAILSKGEKVVLLKVASESSLLELERCHIGTLYCNADCYISRFVADMSGRRLLSSSLFRVEPGHARFRFDD